MKSNKKAINAQILKNTKIKNSYFFFAQSSVWDLLHLGEIPCDESLYDHATLGFNSLEFGLKFEANKTDQLFC